MLKVLAGILFLSFAFPALPSRADDTRKYACQCGYAIGTEREQKRDYEADFEMDLPISRSSTQYYVRGLPCRRGGFGSVLTVQNGEATLGLVDPEKRKVGEVTEFFDSDYAVLPNRFTIKLDAESSGMGVQVVVFCIAEDALVR